jgi:hypothetical protein
MAFFGLTALGPQDPFAACSKNFCNIYVFTNTDFENAWKRVVGDAKFTRIGSLREIVFVLFRGPPPNNDLQRISDGFNLDVQDENSSLSYFDYLNTMLRISEEASREEQEVKLKKKATCEFGSSSEFQESLKRHHRMERRLQDKQIAPLTCSHEYGWEKQTLQKPVAGRETSAVAKFAEELIRNGIYY